MKEFHGVVPPVLTPLDEKRELDVSGLEKLLERMISAGINGVFILGTTGEGPMLGSRVQKAMIDETVRIVRGRIPVLAGVSDAAFDNSVELSLYAKRAGVDALVAASPCYMPLSDGEMVDFFRELSERSAMPLFIYNMPSMTKNYLSPSLVCQLSDIPGICGYKDSAGNMVDFHEVVRRLGGRDDFSIFIGPEELLGEAVLAGADGGVTGGANLNPQVFVDIYRAAVAKDVESVRKLTEKVYIQRQIYSQARTPNGLIRGMKFAMKQLGICEAYPVSPCKPLDDEYTDMVTMVLKQLELL